MSEVKTIDTLIPDIYRLFDEDTHHEPSEENLRRLGEDVIQKVREKLAKREPSEVLRFSSLGRPDRQLWYMKHRPERDKFRAQTLFQFLYGDVIEQVVLFLVRESGHSVEAEQRELEVGGVVGHLDAIIDGVTTDIKSASPAGFKKFSDGTLFEDDPFGYVGQISSYSNVATPREGGAFLAANKVNGELALLKVSPDICAGFDVPARVDHLKGVLDLPEPPPRCYPDVPDGESGNRKLGLNCSYCPHKIECWSDANGGVGLRTFIYSRGPVHLTHVAREPKVPEVF